jgi:acid phosphatase
MDPSARAMLTLLVRRSSIPRGVFVLTAQLARPRALWAALSLLLVAGCGSAGASLPSYARPPAAPSRPVTKLLVVVEENHAPSQVQQGMPYAWWLARTFGYATHYQAVTYPSLPNYLAMAAGDTYGVTVDEPPRHHAMPGPTVFGRALAAGRTAAVYADGMTLPCQRLSDRTAGYGAGGNPWVYFPSERRQCLAHDLPIRALWPAVRRGRLPNIGMLRPGPFHNGHSASIVRADAWLHRTMTRIFAGPDWRSGRLAIVLTWDEDNRLQGDRVLTVVVHPSQRHHVVTASLNHYSIARLYAQVARTSPLRDAAMAPSLARAFGLPVAHQGPRRHEHVGGGPSWHWLRR